MRGLDPGAGEKCRFLDALTLARNDIRRSLGMAHDAGDTMKESVYDVGHPRKRDLLTCIGRRLAPRSSARATGLTTALTVRLGACAPSVGARVASPVQVQSTLPAALDQVF